ncbi:MAG: hypothetical protein PVF56_11860, partial [Desulfobacterales bacterium]|jgi:hypothetical protein
LGKQNTEDQVALETSDQVQNNQAKTEKTNQFIFNVIDDLNKKKQTSLSVEDTNFLVNRLEQLVKEAVENEGGNGSSNSSNEKA